MMKMFMMVTPEVTLLNIINNTNLLNSKLNKEY